MLKLNSKFVYFVNVKLYLEINYFYKYLFRFKKGFKKIFMLY